jgi:hypothetical protein
MKRGSQFLLVDVIKIAGVVGIYIKTPVAGIQRTECVNREPFIVILFHDAIAEYHTVLNSLFG